MSIDAVIPAPTYKPGYYSGFNTTLASRALPTNDQTLVILAQRTTTPDTKTLTPVNVFSDEEAASLFGHGFQAHRMARAAICANDTLPLAVVGMPDSEAGVAATGTLGFKSSASGTGQVRLGVCGETVAIAVTSGDSAGALMVTLVEAINTLDALPVTAAMADIPPPSSGGKSPGERLVLTARSKGACGNQIGVTVTVSAPGVTAALTPMRGGKGEPALDAALGVVGGNGTLSGDTALTTDVNAARLTLGLVSRLNTAQRRAGGDICRHHRQRVRPGTPAQYPGVTRCGHHATGQMAGAQRAEKRAGQRPDAF